MKYLILVILVISLTSSAHNWTAWQQFELICVVRKNEPVTYGANEFVKGKKDGGYEICRWGYVTHYAVLK